MTLGKALEDISKALGNLRHQISLENAAGYLSKNKILENVLLPVLATTYDLSRLRNANVGGSNAPYVDLVDDSKKVAFQITTECKASKITETLEGFVASNTFQKYKTLRFFLFAPTDVAFYKPSREKWSAICKGKFEFKPTDDIVQFGDLYRDISNLNGQKVREIRDLLAQSLVGEEWIDVRALLADQAIAQVNREKETGKYIPDIFVETTSTKALSRIFWHPHLFFGEILDSISHCRLPVWNRFFAKCGLPLLPSIDAEKFRKVASPVDLEKAAKQLEEELLQIRTASQLFDGVKKLDSPPCPISPDNRDFYDHNSWNVRSVLRVAQEWADDQLQKLNAVRRRVFILTGKAGQGKTNLVCDFVERFSVPHELPCAYFTGLQLGRISGDLGEHIQRNLFQGKTPTFQAAAKLLSNYAAERKQPFVFVFEGINEHSRISQFAGELEELVNAALKFPNIRFYFTCRSEYFDERFGNLLKSSFKKEILLVEPRQQYFGDFARDRLLDSYFKYFEIDPDRVDEQAKSFLKDDTLLLRFFCEAYGKRGRSADYKMPDIPHIYRAQVFELYLAKKLDAAADNKIRTVQNLSPRGSKADLLSVIRTVIDYMVANRQFADVPFSVVPEAMHSDLCFLLGEEILLRRDLAAAGGDISLAAPIEVLNFVYDEFRDFLIAKYLVQTFDPKAPDSFAAFVASGEAGAVQISEGIKRFLFYTSRLPDKLEFWKYYSQQPAYTEVFVPEIFFVAAEHLNGDDAVRIRAMLEKADRNATRVANVLLGRGPTDLFPFLNLDLLIDTLADGDDERYRVLICENFLSYYHFQKRSQPAQEWADDLEEHLPYLDPTRHEPYVQLMTILFPLESESDLESPIVRLFRKVEAKFPALAHKVLRRALEFKFTAHRPFVWRLLAEQNLAAAMIADLKILAEGELESASAETVTEIHRFILKSTASFK